MAPDLDQNCEILIIQWDILYTVSSYLHGGRIIRSINNAYSRIAAYSYT